jgi:hypothetical protein
MADEPGGWYVRARGRVLGPFNWAQLETLRDRGQLARFDEVSQDRQAWMGAASLSQLFPNSEARVGSFSSSSPSADPNAYGLVNETGSRQAATSAQDLPSWFYTQGATHQGPVRLQELQQMVANGQVGPGTLVWQKGMPTWIPGHQVAELHFPVTPTPRVGSSGEVAPNPNQGAFATSFTLLPPRTSGLAVASLVLGIVWLCGLGSLLATIFGAVALSQISRSRGTLGGKGLAIAGLILGILGLSLFALPFFTSFLATILDQAQRNRP